MNISYKKKIMEKGDYWSPSPMAIKILNWFLTTVHSACCADLKRYRGHRERPDPKLCVRQQYSFTCQLGFRQKTGAVQQVDLFLNQVEKYRRPRTQVEAVLLDVEKAYNKI